MSLELFGLLIVGVIALAVAALLWNAFWLWWQALLSNAPVSLLQIIFMRFRKVSPAVIVRVRITRKRPASMCLRMSSRRTTWLGVMFNVWCRR